MTRRPIRLTAYEPERQYGMGGYDFYWAANYSDDTNVRKALDFMLKGKIDGSDYWVVDTLRRILDKNRQALIQFFIDLKKQETPNEKEETTNVIEEYESMAHVLSELFQAGGEDIVRDIGEHKPLYPVRKTTDYDSKLWGDSYAKKLLENWGYEIKELEQQVPEDEQTNLQPVEDKEIVKRVEDKVSELQTLYEVIEKAFSPIVDVLEDSEKTNIKESVGTFFTALIKGENSFLSALNMTYFHLVIADSLKSGNFEELENEYATHQNVIKKSILTFFDIFEFSAIAFPYMNKFLSDFLQTNSVLSEAQVKQLKSKIKKPLGTNGVQQVTIRSRLE